MIYKIILNRESEIDCVIAVENNTQTSFQLNSGSRFEVDYLAWVAAGNQPVIVAPDAIAPQSATIEERLEAAELMIDLLLTDTQGGA